MSCAFLKEDINKNIKDSDMQLTKFLNRKISN